MLAESSGARGRLGSLMRRIGRAGERSMFAGIAPVNPKPPNPNRGTSSGEPPIVSPPYHNTRELGLV